MLCSNCGKQIAEGSRFCPECGTKFDDPETPQDQSQNAVEGTRDQIQSTNLVYPKNPPVSPHMALLSIIWPGIPLLIHGQTSKGIVLMVASLVSIIFPLITLIIVVIATIDAYKVGNVLAAGKPIEKWAWFPSV